MKWSEFKKSFLASKDTKACADPKHQWMTPEQLADIMSQTNGASVQVGTPEQALNLDTVYRCVDILSGTIASLPLQLLKRKGDIFVLDEDAPLNYLFARDANPRQSFFILMQNAIISLLLRGNAYILPQRDERGEIISLHLLRPEAVSYDVETNRYFVSDTLASVFRVLEAWEIIHLKNKTLDGGYMGVSTIQYASRVLNISANADQQTLEGFKRGNKSKGFISGGNVMTGMGGVQDSMMRDLENRLEQELSSGKSIMHLPGEVTYTAISMTPSDVQLLENRKFSPYGICRFFGVHPDMVFVEQTSNYKASENSQITFLNQTLRPLLAQIEAEFMSKLILGSQSIRLRREIRFNLMSLFATDLKSRAEYAKISIECGALTPNEWRIMENRDKMEGGDQLFISCNVAPIKSYLTSEAPPEPKPKADDTTKPTPP